MKQTKYLQALESQLDVLQYYSKLLALPKQFHTDMLEARMSLRTLVSCLHMASPIYVENKIAEIIEKVPVVDEYTPIKENIPIQSGFALFEKSVFRLTSPAEIDKTCDAIAWAVTETDIFWSYLWRNPDNLLECVTFFSGAFKEKRTRNYVLYDLKELTPWVITDHDKKAGFTNTQQERGIIAKHLDDMEFHSWAILDALFIIMNEKIAKVSNHRIDRAARRRVEKITPNDKLFDIIELREYEYQESQFEEKPSHGGYNIRWIVRGHWHLYHTKNGPIKKYLQPYVKGPENAPVKNAAKIFALVR